MPKSEPIDFWFSIGSMFTFLTVMRIDRVEDMTDIRFVWRPFSVRHHDRDGQPTDVEA